MVCMGKTAWTNEWYVYPTLCFYTISAHSGLCRIRSGGGRDGRPRIAEGETRKAFEMGVENVWFSSEAAKLKKPETVGFFTPRKFRFSL